MVRTGDLIKLATERIRYLGKLKLVSIDNWAFTIHYRLTAITLLLMSLFITCQQFFGDPINCIKTNDIAIKIINNFCWIQGTFTLPRALIIDMEREQKGLPPLKAAPGIDHRHKDDEIIVHNYYYWVCIVLFLQGCSFMVTRVLWKVWEKGYMKLLIEGINKSMATQNKRFERSIAITLFLNKRRFDLKGYSRKFFICEIANLINIIIQIYITDLFLRGQFLHYGWDMMFNSKRIDPTDKVFPKLGKCTFRRFGSSGDVQSYDSLCVLPLNIVNEKFYLVIWFLFFTVLAISFWAVFIRIMLMMFKELRFYYIQTYNKHINEEYFRSVFSNSSYSYWFILYLLSCNLEPMHFRDVILSINHFKENQEMPTELIGWDIPLKKRLAQQNGFKPKRASEEKSKLIVQMPSEETNEITEIEVKERFPLNDSTLKRSEKIDE